MFIVKLKETYLIKDLKPASVNENMGSEKPFLY